jgi:hypothetical protein
MSIRGLCRIAVLIAGVLVAVPAACIGVSSDAHRPDARGNYGGLKSQHAPLRGSQVPGAKSDSLKQPYDYRYYSDTDRSPGSCLRFARRAIATKNSNWWTRYRACKD